MPIHQHAITALVQNESGTINRIVSLFRRRGFSLASFTAGDCEQPGFSRLTFLVEGDDAVVEQVLRQLVKLIDVVECLDLTPDDRIMREVALVSFDPDKIDRAQLEAVAVEFEAKIEYDAPHCLVLMYAGPVRLVEHFLRAISAFPVKEIVRTGPCAVPVRT